MLDHDIEYATNIMQSIRHTNETVRRSFDWAISTYGYEEIALTMDQPEYRIQANKMKENNNK